jgi:hypothetical protein
MFDRFFLKRKIKRYARQLPLELKMMYGRQSYYSKIQVDTAMARKKLGNNGEVVVTDSSYAYAMYCSQQVFDEIHQQAEQSCDYTVMRSTVSYVVFGGPMDFSVSTLVFEATHAK